MSRTLVRTMLLELAERSLTGADSSNFSDHTYAMKNLA